MMAKHDQLIAVCCQEIGLEPKKHPQNLHDRVVKWLFHSQFSGIFQTQLIRKLPN